MAAAYLDHAATTPVRPSAVAAMLPYLTEHFGNPSGSHATARRAKQAVEDARDVVAAALGRAPSEIVFTSGGTEADNLAVLGVAAPAGPGGGSILCSAVEHHAVLDAVASVGGATVPVTAGGLVDLDALADALRARPAPRLVSVMLANNEVGVVQPLGDVVALVRELAPTTVVHTDAVHAVSWLDVAALTAGCDLVTLSAHKFGGPKGVGVLAVRDGLALAPVVHGGGQERGRRSGTHDVAGIVGLAAALDETVRTRAETVARVAPLRDRLVDGLVASVTGVVETGDRATKVAGNAHVRIRGVENEALLVLLDDAGVCASAGSACASGALEPSHVLAAMGVPGDEAAGAVRFSLGATTTPDEVELALKATPDAVARLRG